MKDNQVYTLIIFIIFIFIHKLVALIIELKYPTYQDINKSESFYKTLIKIRYVFNIIEVICIFYFFIFFDLNAYLKVLLLLFLSLPIKYFLFDERLIYKFVKNNDTNKKWINIIDIYDDRILNMFIGLYAIYAIIYIFKNK
jgi:hypothetical protein